jgi:hypothetical protein
MRPLSLSLAIAMRDSADDLGVLRTLRVRRSHKQRACSVFAAISNGKRRSAAKRCERVIVLDFTAQLFAALSDYQRTAATTYCKKTAVWMKSSTQSARRFESAMSELSEKRIRQVMFQTGVEGRRLLRI